MRVFPIPLLSRVRGLVRRAPTSRMYAVPALACTNSTISHSEQSKEGNFDVNSLELNEVGFLRVLTSMRDDPYLALSFLKRIEGNGALPSVQAYAAVIRIVCSWSLDEKLSHLFVGLIRKGDEGRGFSVVDLLKAVGEAEENEKLCFLLLSRVSSALVKAYAKVEMFEEAIVLFWGIEKLRWDADAQAYVVVVQALHRKGDSQEVEKFLSKLLSSEMRRHRVFYMDFIEGLCVNEMALEAYILLRPLRDANILVDESDLAVAYRRVIRGLCNEMKLEEAESALLDMEKCVIDPDACVYSAVIEGHRKNMSFSKALRFVNDKVSQRIINPVIASSILQCCCQMGKFSEAYDQFIDFRNRNITLDRFCYNVAFDALIKLGRVDEAIELFREMTREGIAPDVVNYTTLIGGCCQQGRCEEAIDLIIEMENKGKPPDIVAYNVLAGGLARNAENASDILSIMEARGVKPTSVTHNMVIQGLIVAGKIEEAEALNQSLEEHNKPGGHVASIVKGYCEAGRLDEAFERFIRIDFPLPKNVYFTLFTSLCCAKDKHHIDKAQKLLERMWELGVEPVKSMYGKLIGAWCRVGNVRKAMRFLEVLKSREIVPDLFTYTIMIKTFKPDVVTYTVLAKNNPKIDEDMKACGVKPDVFYYTTMINTYYRLNEEKKALAVVQEMKRGGIVPDVAMYTALIDSYYRLNNRKIAYDTFQEMKRRRFCPDVVTYTVLLNHDPKLDLKREMRAFGIKRDVHYYTVLIHHKFKIGEVEEAERIFHEMFVSGVEPDVVCYTAIIAGFLRNGYVPKFNTKRRSSRRRSKKPIILGEVQRSLLIS
ncbi:hypothetical protein Bca101_044071 [Brassica carinata]